MSTTEIETGVPRKVIIYDIGEHPFLVAIVISSAFLVLQDIKKHLQVATISPDMITLLEGASTIIIKIKIIITKTLPYCLFNSRSITDQISLSANVLCHVAMPAKLYL